IIEVPVPETLCRTTVRGIVTPPADQQTIRPDADLLFVAGAGWTKKQKDGQAHVPEAETIILDFLKKSKASLGGSKSLVDISGENEAALRFMGHLNQVGQTGASRRLRGDGQGQRAAGREVTATGKDDLRGRLG